MNRSGTRSLLLGAASLTAAGLVAAPLHGQVDVSSLPGDRAPVMAQRVARPAAAPAATPASRQAWEAVPSLGFGRLDIAALEAQDRIRDRQPGVPMRVGVNRPVPGRPVSADTDGTWQRLSDDLWQWRFRIEVGDGIGLRVHFADLDLPADGRLLVAGDPAGPLATYRGRGPREAGAFWSTLTAGPVVYLEYEGPDPEGMAPVIEIDAVSQMYRGGSLLEPGGPEADSGAAGLLVCHRDVNCFGVDQIARDSVARIIFTRPGEGTFLCSGGLLNDVDQNTFAGYFLTANHCISDQPTADSLIAYWFYQSNGCNGFVPSLGSRPRSEGADLLVTGHRNSVTDFTLLRLFDDPNEGQGFAAWTTDVVATDGQTVKGIHHPGGDFKRYAEGPTTSAPPICSSLPLNRYIYNDWTPGRGVTEGGSSGSPLFNTDWEVIGQLFGVCFFDEPLCSNPEDYNNVYGRVSYASGALNFFLNSTTPDDPYEDNDTPVEPPALALGQHELHLVDFHDYFAVTVTGTVELAATATFEHSVVNVDLELLTQSGSLLDRSDGSTDLEAVAAVVEPGTYIVHASRDGGRGGVYTLDLRTFSGACDNPAAVQAEPDGEAKNRYISFIPGNPGIQAAIRVTLASMYNPDPPNSPLSPAPDFSALEQQVMWVGPPAQFREGGNPEPTFTAARLQCDPHYQDWGDVGLLHTFGPEVVPSSIYEIQILEEGCNPATRLSVALNLPTRRWGDIIAPFAPETAAQPTFTDIGAMVAKFKELPTAVIKARAQLQPALVDPDARVSFLDIGRAVDGFKQRAYPFPSPTPCP